MIFRSSDVHFRTSNVGAMCSMTAGMHTALLQAIILRSESDRILVLWKHLSSTSRATNTLLILMHCITPTSSDHSFRDISWFQFHCSKTAKKSITSLQLSFMPPRMGDGRQHKRNEMRRRPLKRPLCKVVARE
jgi:hypothetical protein